MIITFFTTTIELRNKCKKVHSSNQQSSQRRENLNRDCMSHSDSDIKHEMIEEIDSNNGPEGSHEDKVEAS